MADEKTKVLRFRATGAIKVYSGRGLKSIENGSTVTVSEEDAKYLLKTFPDNWDAVRGKAALKEYEEKAKDAKLEGNKVVPAETEESSSAAIIG
jgi:hypothetical protein